MYDEKKLEWCHNYMSELRELELTKFDEVTAKIMEYMDFHVKRSDADKEKDATNNKNRKGFDASKKPRLDLLHERKDVLYGLFANVSSTNMSFQ